MLRYSNPDIGSSVLELHEVPEERFVCTRVRVPVLVLAVRNGVKIEDDEETFLGAEIDDAVKYFEAIFFIDTRIEVISK